MSHCYECNTDVVDTATGVACLCRSADIDDGSIHQRVPLGCAIEQASIEEQAMDGGIACALDALSGGDHSKWPNTRTAVKAIGMCYRGEISRDGLVKTLRALIET